MNKMTIPHTTYWEVSISPTPHMWTGRNTCLWYGVSVVTNKYGYE